MPTRKDVVRAVFDSWSRIEGTWIKYTFAKIRGEEYVVVFNVYGAAVILDTLQLLKEGGCEEVFFIGSMYAKNLPVGSLVIPVRVTDMAGPPMVDDPLKRVIKLNQKALLRIKEALEKREVGYVEASIASVPAVLHGMDRLNKRVASDKSLLGVELETSTFIHFSEKLGLKGYPLLHVSDNDKYGLVSNTRTVREARRRALRESTLVALDVLRRS